MRLEKTAKLGASRFVPIIKYQGDKKLRMKLVTWHTSESREMLTGPG